MSAKKELQIQMTGPEAASTVSAADMMGGSMPAEPTKRKGLPAAGEPWLLEHDMVVMGRLGRAIAGVPAAAMQRISPWFTAVCTEVMFPEPQPQQPPAETSGGLKVYR